MVVKVYIWKFGGKSANENWGHASIELSDGTYISWWPEKPVGGKGSALIPFEWVNAHQNRTLQEDITAEEKNPDDTIIFDRILDEEKIKEWWKRFKGNNQFNGLLNNCSTVVYYALQAGGAMKYVMVPKNLVWHPNEIQRFAKEVFRNYKSHSRRTVPFPELSSDLMKLAQRASQLGSVSYASLSL